MYAIKSTRGRQATEILSSALTHCKAVSWLRRALGWARVGRGSTRVLCKRTYTNL